MEDVKSCSCRRDQDLVQAFFFFFYIVCTRICCSVLLNNVDGGRILFTSNVQTVNI